MMPDKSTFAGKIRIAFPTFSRIPHCLKRGSCRFALFSWQCWNKSWRYLLGFAILLIAFDVALGIYATVQLNHQLDLIRQKGEPLTLEELVPPPIPDEENAAVLYTRALEKINFEIRSMPLPPDSSGDPTIHYEKDKYIPSYPDQKDLSAYLAKNTVAIDLMRKAALMQKCQFKLSLNPYWGPHIKGGKEYDLLRLMKLQAIYEARNGNTNAALQDVRCLFLMTRQFSTAPTGSSVYSTLGRTGKSNLVLSKVLLYTAISPKQAQVFESSLPSIDLKALANRDFLVNRITSINEFESSAWPYLLFDDNFPAETSLLKFRGILNLTTTPVRKLDEISALKYLVIAHQRYQKILFPAPPNYHDAQTDKIIQEIDNTPFYALGTKLTSYEIPNGIPEKMEITRRERIIALALAAYHKRYHHYPSTLKSLEEFWGSALPKDLYSGKSFHYRSDGKTFYLYSVGNNRVDDRGETIPYPHKDDIEWPNNTSLF